MLHQLMIFFFFFNYTATTEIYTLSLHDALPISQIPNAGIQGCWQNNFCHSFDLVPAAGVEPATFRSGGERSNPRSEEHTSELQSRLHLVCRLLLEKKKTYKSRLTLLSH